VLQFAQSRNLKNIAIIRLLNGGFWQFTRNLFVEGAAKYGITVVSDENVGDPFTTDFRTVITKTKVKKPDAVFIVFSEVSECAFLKQAKELGLDVPVLSTESAGNNASLSQCVGLLDNLHFSAPRQTEAYGVFSEAFKKKFGVVPEFPSAATAYDAVRVVTQAMQDAGMQGGVALRDAVASIKDYPGIFIPHISFNEKGFIMTPVGTYAMHMVRDGKFVQE
jgi:ABC-type branched-subunit amino acid transport system substrate-binding protein